MSKQYFLPLLLVLLFSCNQPASWEQVNYIELEGISPIGLVLQEGNFWIADGDNNRLVQLASDGTILSTIDGFERPMHLAEANGRLYIPEYGADQITVLEDTTRSIYPVKEKMDAPAGVAVYDKELGIVDFYNHRVLFFNGSDWIIFGQKGKEDGAFDYPTDLHIGDDKIYIADAYNNRVQVFNKKGQHLLTFGEAEEMNAATGLTVYDDRVFVTDFENDRIMIYTLEGQFIQAIDEVPKPIDVLFDQNKLYVAHFQDKAIGVYKQ
ncbi:MAG: NHL repeat-containing protein, partial [Bacteroidota bacterium]